MKRAAVLHGVDQHWILLQIAALDSLADADDVLFDDASRANVQMSDFGVAHLAGRESHGLAGSFERCPRRFAIQPVETRRLRLGNCVVLPLFAAAESVNDDENEKGWLSHGAGILAVRPTSQLPNRLASPF